MHTRSTIRSGPTSMSPPATDTPSCPTTSGWPVPIDTLYAPLTVVTCTFVNWLRFATARSRCIEQLVRRLALRAGGGDLAVQRGDLAGVGVDLRDRAGERLLTPGEAGCSCGRGVDLVGERLRAAHQRLPRRRRAGRSRPTAGREIARHAGANTRGRIAHEVVQLRQHRVVGVQRTAGGLRVIELLWSGTSCMNA